MVAIIACFKQNIGPSSPNTKATSSNLIYDCYIDVNVSSLNVLVFLNMIRSIDARPPCIIIEASKKQMATFSY